MSTVQVVNLRQDFAARFGWPRADYPKTEAETKSATEAIVATAKVTELRSWAERAGTRKGGLKDEIAADLVAAIKALSGGTGTDDAAKAEEAKKLAEDARKAEEAKRAAEDAKKLEEAKKASGDAPATRMDEAAVRSGMVTVLPKHWSWGNTALLLSPAAWPCMLARHPCTASALVTPVGTRGAFGEELYQCWVQLCGATKEEASSPLSIFVRIRMVVSAWTLEGDGVVDHLFALLRQDLRDGRDVCLGVQQRIISSEDRSAARQVGTRARLQALPLTEDVRNLVDKARINLQSEGNGSKGIICRHCHARVTDIVGHLKKECPHNPRRAGAGAPAGDGKVADPNPAAQKRRRR